MKKELESCWRRKKRVTYVFKCYNCFKFGILGVALSHVAEVSYSNNVFKRSPKTFADDGGLVHCN